MTPSRPMTRKARETRRSSCPASWPSHKETLHQTRFSAIVDLSLAAERSRSFQRMIRAVALLFDASG